MKAMYCAQTYETSGRPVTNPVLINSMRAGLDQAWGQLYAVYWNWLVQLALGMGVNRQDAEDLAQRTFIALAKSISTFIYEPARGRFSGWLSTVLRRNVSNFWRRGSSDPLRLSACQEATDPGQFDGFVALENQVISEALANDLKQVIEESYAELKTQVPEVQWQIFDLYHLQERSVEEIASRFNRKPGSIYSIESRMLQKLSAIMRRRMHAAYGEDVFAELWNTLGNQSGH